jgi:hypothetical protein
MLDDMDLIHDRIHGQMQLGTVVPVLGAGVNMCGRPAETEWSRGQYLPSGGELARYLAHRARYPDAHEADLARVSQYLSAVLGERTLYDDLRDVFDVDYPPTALHGFLAAMAHRPTSSTNRDRSGRGMLFLTTNYDDGLERAFRAAGQPFDLITYVAQGRERGLFRHTRPDGDSTLIKVPNKYTEIDFRERPVIAKIHGAVDRVLEDDSFVITEDHYVDYISRADPSKLFPVHVAAKLRKSHLLYLGYSLRDWNFRVLLYRLWAEQDGLDQKSWAIEARPTPVDSAAWLQRGVDIIPEDLATFVDQMQRRGSGPSAAA